MLSSFLLRLLWLLGFWWGLGEDGVQESPVGVAGVEEDSGSVVGEVGESVSDVFDEVVDAFLLARWRVSCAGRRGFVVSIGLNARELLYFWWAACTPSSVNKAVKHARGLLVVVLLVVVLLVGFA